MSVIEHIATIVLPSFMTGIIGYRLGRQAHKENEKHKSKIKLFYAIDEVVGRIPVKATVRDLFRGEKEAIRKATLQFSSHLSERRRATLDRALQAYLTLDINVAPNPLLTVNQIPQSIDMDRVADERQAMLYGLQHLRDTAEKL